MEILPETCLSYTTKQNKKTRDLISTMVKAFWRTLNEWTLASNSGLQSLRNAVRILVNVTCDNALPCQIHQQCAELNVHIDTMKKAVKTLDGLNEQLKKVITIQETERPGCTFEPQFLSLPLNEFSVAFSQLLQACKRETEFKIGVCKPLAHTTDSDILNACITLWSRSLNYLQPHLYHIKILLLECHLL
ncbi:hypothetical protein Anas_10309 [Armadillidium nasatum]|uniref:Uncharacterized protein n=1 Tax=Armadillidium nasatum TaxID=96803 RepID=A0A5N5TMP0_9CRUS|nr:hypothetical protein Anas_10309 [Armadillidium nasatum]